MLWRFQPRIWELAHDFVRQLLDYRTQPWRVLGALLCSIMLTTIYVAVLFVCALSLGVHITWWHVFIIFTVGIAAGTATPTPGGLVGAEAGLVAGFVAYGQPAAVALAIALLYRLLTYWAPMVPGFVVFTIVRKRYFL
jgi:uncharacterized protein (TIRG00374 family)